MTQALYAHMSNKRKKKKLSFKNEGEMRNLSDKQN
jgi:hypothetical protein